MILAAKIIGVLAAVLLALTATGLLVVGITNSTLMAYAVQQELSHYIKFGTWRPTLDQLKLQSQETIHAQTTETLRKRIVELETINTELRSELETITNAVLSKIQDR